MNISFAAIDAHGYDGFWYRCEVKRYAATDEWGDDTWTVTNIVWRKFAPIKITPKGVWLTDTSMTDTNPDRWLENPPTNHFVAPKLVLGNTKRQWACPTKDLAWADCRARKLLHISYSRKRLQLAENDLILLNTKRPRSTEKVLA